MKRKCLLTVLAIAMLASTALLFADEVTKEETHELKLNKGGSLRLSANEGDIEIEGWDRDVIELRMIKHAWGRTRREAEERMEEIDVVIRQSDDRVTVREMPPEGRDGRTVFNIFGSRDRWRTQVVDFILKVPNDLNLNIRGDESNVTISSLTAKLSIEVDEGSVLLSDVILEDCSISLDEGDVELKSCRQKTGSYTKITSDEGRVEILGGEFDDVDVTCDEGNVIMEKVSVSRFWISTDEGDVNIDILPKQDGVYRIEVDEGDIDVALPASADLKVRLYADEGRVETDWNLKSRDTEDGEIVEGRIGKGNNGQLKAVTEEGDIYMSKSR